MLRRVSGVLHVFPSNAHVERRLGALNLGAHATEERSTTVARLEGDLARALLPRRVMAAPEVVRIVVRRVAARIEAFGGAHLPATAAALDRTLRELRRAGVDERRLLRAAERCARKREKNQAEMLARAMHAVDAELDVLGVIDPASIPTRLAVALRSRVDDAALCLALGASRRLVFHDLVGASPARLSWIEALHATCSRLGGGVIVELPTEPPSLLSGCGVDDPRERIAASVEERFRAIDHPPELVHRAAGSTSPHARVASRLFHAGAPSADERPVHLVEAASVSVAADVVACEIAAALQRGVAPSRVVVALPALDESIVRPLRRALGRLGVACFEARGAPPSSARPVARFLELLRAVERGLRKEDLIDLLRSTPSILPTRRHAVARALEQTAGTDLVGDGGSILRALELADRASIEPMVQTLLAVAAPCGRAEMLRRVARIAEISGISRAFVRGDVIDVLGREDAELVDAIAADVAAVRALATAIDDLARATNLAAAEAEPIDIGEQTRELEAALETRRSVQGSRTGAVTVARLRDRLGLDADVLFVLEAHDGALPSRAPPDPLLPHALVAALREVDALHAPPPRSFAAAIDLLAAIDAIGATNERVYVVHRAVDEDGRAQLPGALVGELKRVAACEVRRARARIFPDATTPPRRRGDTLLAAHHRAARALLGAAPLPEGLDAAAVARAYAESCRTSAFARAALGDAASGETTGRIDLDASSRATLLRRLRGGIDAPFPATALDALLDCPFVVFAERVLGARRDGALEEDGGAKEAGIQVHRALEAILRDPLAALHVDDARFVARAKEIAQSIIDVDGASSALQRLRRTRLVEQVVALVVADRDEMRATNRRFVDAEVPFGEPGAAWPALVFGEGDDAVHVQGRIDRWDRVGDDRALVIDYKTSPPASTSDAFFHGRAPKASVQLAVYARAVAKYAVPPVVFVFGRYFGYRRAELGGAIGATKSGDDAVWRAQVGDAAGGEGEGDVARRVVAAFASVREGVVAPRRGQRCERCAQRAACRAPDVVLEGGGE